MKRVLVCLAVLAFFGLAGCSTVLTGISETVNVKSIPPEATVKIYDTRSNVEVANGITPVSVELRKGHPYFRPGSYRIVIEKAGYETQEQSLVGYPSPWYIGGNIFIGGALGYLIVDPLTGGMWTFESFGTKEINMTLKKLETSSVIEPSAAIKKE